MSRFVALLLAAAVLLPFAGRAQDEAEAPSSPLDFTMTNIYGQDVDLSRYKGQVVMIVNVASKCGNTKQYKPLQAMFEKYKDQGFMVIGIPANEFGRQEPGTNEEIITFCKEKFDVSFDMYAKAVVKGEGICPLYQYLTSKDAGHEFGGPISWNFEKFLVGRDGQLIARYKPGLKPDTPQVVSDVEAALAVEIDHVDTGE